MPLTAIVPRILATLLSLAMSASAYAQTPTAQPAVLVAAGDITSCYDDNDEATARLLDGIDGMVATLGDNAYDRGTATEFESCYDPTWGRHRARTRPVPGNHDYYTPGAAGYFAYFRQEAGDPTRGYYSYDLGDWHIVALNTNCAEIGGCGEGSPELTWLEADLAAHPAQCTLAYGHHPLFSSGKHGGESDLVAMWDLLDRSGVDVMLAGHDHVYERFAPQDAWGTADPAGIRQFVVGTGGVHLYPLATPQPNSEARSNEAFGVLELTLRVDGYDWAFIPVEGETFTDSGSASCS